MAANAASSKIRTLGFHAGSRRGGIVHRSGRILIIGLTLALLLSACGVTRSPELAGPVVGGDVEPFHPDGWEGSELPPLGLFDPVAEGAQIPNGFRQLLARDAIFPVYRPEFLTSDQIDWPDDELVVGVDLEGEARAYPVGFLNHREIVVDMHRGIPTFVTW